MAERTHGVIILGTDGDSTRAIYHALVRRVPVVRVILERRISRRQLLRARARKLGPARALSQAAFSAAVVPVLRAAGRRRVEEMRNRTCGGVPIPSELVERVSSVNSPDCIALLQRLAPGVVVISGTRIIGSNVLTAIGTVVINMHAGITPRYRGTHGAYWALAEGHPEHAGVTVHVVDRGIDTGGIVAQTIVHPTGEDSFVTLPYLQLEAGLPLLVEATAAALRGQLATIPSLDPAESKLWFHPTLREYFSNWLRRGVR